MKKQRNKGIKGKEQKVRRKTVRRRESGHKEEKKENKVSIKRKKK